MRTTALLASLAATLASAACASAPAGAPSRPAAERAAFVTTLGADTVVVERMSRQGNELRAEVLVRAPRTTLRSYHMRLGDDGRPTTLVTTTHDPVAGVGSAALTTQTIRFGADSLRIETTGGQAPGTIAVAGGRDVLPFIDMVHWPFELMLQRAHAAGADSIAIPLLTGRQTQNFTVRRTGGNGYTVTHPFRGTMTAQGDAAGRLVSLDASQTTRKLTVTRTADVDLPALARAFAARDAEGRAFGELSGRGEATATIAGANIGVDYGRPAKRGREIFGTLVPYGEVWRLGANRATHLTTSRDLRLGGTPLPAGTYTLFAIPRADGWTLIVNRRTDINGTAHDAAHDLARIQLPVRTLPSSVEDFTVVVEPQGAGGVLRFQWDRTEAHVPIEVAGG